MSSNTLFDQVESWIADRDAAAAARFRKAIGVPSSDPSGQIAQLNRYWRTELGRLSVSTVSARTCLIDDIAPVDWSRHFLRIVLPLIVTYHLPREQ